MSAEQTRKTLEQLDKDISTLSKKSADLGKKEADARGKAAHVSIPKSASANTIRSKMSQITRYESDANKAATAKADIDKKIADKQKKRGIAFAKLQKEESADRKKDSEAQAMLQRRYEQQIEALTERLNSQAVAPLTNPVVSAEDEPDEYDVFVSHAWEDKESFVEEFVDELSSLGLRVWYDQSQIKWGDSTREKIERGLSK
jgi:chromosome segregation ATPase